MPALEHDPRTGSTDGDFIRSEFQVLFRLPRSGAVVFSIHTYMLLRADLTPDQAAGLEGAGVLAGH